MVDKSRSLGVLTAAVIDEKRELEKKRHCKFSESLVDHGSIALYSMPPELG